MTIIQKRVMTWIVDTHRLSCRQKGCIPRDGLQEHVFCLKTSISDLLHSNTKRFITFLDLADAFGSVDHDFMILSMKSAGYPDFLLKLTRDIYTGSSFVVKTCGSVTRPVSRMRGIIQGDPYSVICFEQTIDPWLRWIDNNSPPTRLPAPIQGYVDDVSLSTDSENELEIMAIKTEIFIDAAGMKVKHRKCAIIQGERSGKKWKAKSKTSQIKINIQDSDIPVYEREKGYPYLGYQIRIDNKSDTAETLIAAFKDTMKQIDRSLLPITAKLQAVNIMAISKLNFFFPNTIFSENELKELEDEIVSSARHWLKLNDSSSRAFFFTPRSKGGLGLINPRVSYYAKYLQFHLAVLNSNDEAVKYAARESLSLHMTKRQAQKHRGNNNFAGYATSGNSIIKESSVHWPKSYWVHIFDMCFREGIQLHITSSDVYEYVHELKIDGEIKPVHCEHPRAFYSTYKDHKLNMFETAFKTLSSQGRIEREVTEDADMQLSSAFLKNHKLKDDIISFVIRGRLQLLQCNSLMHTYFHTSKACDQCDFYTETVSHILNGCKAMKNIYQKRHNRIVDMLYIKLTSKNPNVKIIKDSIIRPQTFDETSPRLQFTCPAIRPDIVVVNDIEKTAFIVEIATPFDSFIGRCYDEKFNKYFPLTVELNELGYYTKVIVLIIGSLGHVHKKFINGLKILGLSSRESKFIAKFYATSVIIGSYKVWKQRCKKTHYEF